MNWRDALTAAGLFIALGGIIVTVGLYRASQTQARLELQLLSNVEFAAPGGPFADRIQVLLDGQDVEKVWLVYRQHIWDS